MVRVIITLFLLLFTSFFWGCGTQPAPLKTTERVDLSRYGGTWYEIARYPNRFERKCQGATARYTIKEGRIEVLNRCFDDKGREISHALGHARSLNPQNTRLEVSFFWPFYGDYWVLSLPTDYRYSVVGEPSREYFWILSRTPTLSPKDREAILNHMPQWGYEPKKLIWNHYTTQGDY